MNNAEAWQALADAAKAKDSEKVKALITEHFPNVPYLTHWQEDLQYVYEVASIFAKRFNESK